MDFNVIYQKVKLSMTDKDGNVNKRFYHSESVMNKALEINKELNLGLNEDKIKLAGILHDCAKLVDKEYLLKLMIENNDAEHLEEIKESLPIIHALGGYWYAKKVYNIQDEEVLNAIKYHCTGKANMSMLEELIFVSDYVEDLREGSFFDAVRDALKINLKHACMEEIKQVMQYFEKNKIKAYYLTKEAWDYYKSF